MHALNKMTTLLLVGSCLYFTNVDADEVNRNFQRAVDRRFIHSPVDNGNFGDQWFRVFGHWDGSTLRADNIQLRRPDKSPDKGQVSGRVEQIDYQSKTLKIGPFAIDWSNETRFDSLKPKRIHPGMTLKISGVIIDATHFSARSIAQEATPYASGSLQVTGLSSDSIEQADGIHEFTVLNIPVYTAQNGYNTFKSLIRRQDVRRPDDQFKFNLFGKPVTIGGEYDITTNLRDDYDLDHNDQDRSIRLDQELKLEAFYPISNFTAMFISFKGIAESRFNLDSDSSDRTLMGIARDETWIFFDRIGGTGFGLQLGNQNVSEAREWWWDKDMDAVRLYYNNGPVHFELLGGQQSRESTLEDLSPEENQLARLMGLGSWMWSSKQRLEFYFLQQWDKSNEEGIGTIINKAHRDTNDATMTWFGARAIGEFGIGDYGTMNYWADFAGVHGDETVINYKSVDDQLTQVTAKYRNKVDAWAFDIGAFWTLPIKYEPTFTLSYAHGSGDDQPNDGHNSTFRQTGIQRNKWRFNGVNRFRIYGELLRPELSNLDIFTSAYGMKLFKNSSLELIYHKYDQVEAIDNLRRANINADPTGNDPDIGQEIDLVMNFREWKQLELGLTAAVFDPGSAFDSNHRDLAYSVFFDVNYNF